MKTKFGAVIVDGRGKIGGHVASKNRSGSYLRTKVTPVNPNTPAQSAIRSSFKEAAQLFRSLTLAQILAWNTAAAGFAKNNIFGDSVKPTGLNACIKINQNASLIGATPVTDFPGFDAPEVLIAPVVNIAVGAATMSYSDASGVVAAEHIIIRATEPLSKSVNYVKNKLRIVAVINRNVAGPYDLKANYLAQFGALPTIDQHVVFEVQALNDATYVTGLGQSFEATIVA